MTIDVIIAGGGTAGVAMAAALAEFGYEVLIIEPGLDRTKRLAGELIHPTGVSDLNELGLLNGLEESGANSIQGFAVFGDDRSAAAAYLLPYVATAGRRKYGLAIEYPILSEVLLTAIQKFPRVTVWNSARVTSIDVTQRDIATVTVNRTGSESQLSAKLVVAADGRNSRLCRMAGIAHKQVHISNMIGYSLANACLPHPGFGHVFVRGPAPVLAYTVGRETTRIMFDLPEPSHGRPEPEYIHSQVEALPQPLRSAVERALETQTPLRSTNDSIIPETVIKGRLVCAGDAGGCCHPLTATGLTACTRDAIRLRQALRESRGDIPSALRRYAAQRDGPQRTRLVAAEVLYDVFRAQTPETRLLRQGLLRYWHRSERGRETTLALLSTQEDRVSILVREYIQVCRYALPSLIHWRSENGAHPLHTRSHAMAGLSRAFVKFLAQTCLG